MTATKKPRKHPKLSRRSALARPTGSAFREVLAFIVTLGTLGTVCGHCFSSVDTDVMMGGICKCNTPNGELSDAAKPHSLG